MRLPRRQFLRLAGLTTALPVSARIATAQAYPAQPVTLIVPLPAGSSVDVNLRALATATQKHLGQPIIIENRPGAGTTLGPAQMAATAKPDGYTISQIGSPIFRAPFLRKTTYDPTKDFTYVIAVIGLTFGVVVRRDAPWTTFEQFLADAKANPGKINYATPGVGTDAHITMERIARHQGVKLVHVPFAGSSVNALLGGHIHAVAEGSAWAPQVNSGELRLLVTFGAGRSKNWPTVPTLKESGIDIAVNAAYGLAGPRGMDPTIVETLHGALKNGTEEPSFVATVERFGQEVFYLGSNAFREFALRQIAEQKRIVEELGLKEE
jgi:tripartite-type tricarboxylate transporter receptor subunit TctC